MDQWWNGRHAGLCSKKIERICRNINVDGVNSKKA